MMSDNSMTARISAFARAYHTQHSSAPVYADTMAKPLLGEDYTLAAQSLAGGIAFFDPTFSGTSEAALKHIVNSTLAPSVLGRAAFAEQSAKTAVRIGARQIVLLGAGYDTFAYRRPIWAQPLPVFELDRTDMLRDKQTRLRNAQIEIPENTAYVEADFCELSPLKSLSEHPAFDGEKITFCTALGLCYYLPQTCFRTLLNAVCTLIPQGSSIVFDYPIRHGHDEGTQKREALAAGANEAMCAAYMPSEMEKLLEDCGFIIAEELAPEEITQRFFAAHNAAEPSSPLYATENVHYVLAVRHR